ncbi:MAG TPA: hypothetical protein VN667_18450 [Burkholderiales bacterium]|nr:hypothetical protein [Burkholderiales bacterium]
MLRFLWLCAGVPFVFFSLSSAKANYYILLCVPPMAILAAHFMRPLSEGRNRILLALAVSIPVAVLVLIWSYRMWARVHGKTPALLPQPDGSMHLTMAVIMAITVMILTMVQLGWRRLAVASLGALIFPISLEMDHIVARAEPYLSARVMADYIQNHYAHETVYLYQDFEAFGALPVYLRRRVPIVDSKSSDLAYGRGVFLGSPIFYSVQEVLGAGAPSLVIVLQSREPAFKQSGLAEKSTSVISVGNAHLYRLDLHKND